MHKRQDLNWVRLLKIAQLYIKKHVYSAMSTAELNLSIKVVLLVHFIAFQWKCLTKNLVFCEVQSI